jgi:hypothetical protein
LDGWQQLQRQQQATGGNGSNDHNNGRRMHVNVANNGGVEGKSSNTILDVFH